MYDEKYRIVLMNITGKVLFKSSIKPKIKVTLYLLIHCGHFDVLENPGKEHRIT